MTPVDREEKFLAAAVGDISSSELPSPVTRKEEYLNRLVDKVENIEEEIEDLEKLKNWLGYTTTPITENSTVNPIEISGRMVTAKNGDITAYNDGTSITSFRFSDVGTWQIYDDKTDVYTKYEADAKFADKTRTADALDDLNHDLSLAQSDITNLQNAVERMSYTVVLTQAEYDELSIAQKQNGTIYFTDDTNRIYKNGVEYNGAVDSAMSASSTNPVQNKVIKEYVDNAIAAITDYESEVFPNA